MTKDYINPDFKLGILGGGQLGKMMALAIGNWHLPIYFLDQSKAFPAGPYGMGFTEGSFKNYQDVYEFGKDKDVLSIEIEHVNTEALKALQAQGVIIHPAPEKLEIIKDKGLQKQFYAQQELPTSPFKLYPDKKSLLEAIETGDRTLPFVQKSRTAGYDGKGVAVIESEKDYDKILEGPSMVEDKVDILKELSVIVARNPSGDICSYPTVEMEFNPEANLVEFLFAPANISEAQEAFAQNLARKTIEAFDLCGLLAVELFLDQEGNILINEVAPRPHNSGHQTIDGNFTSQFEQHIRAILDLPLGNPSLRSGAAVMVNLLGEPGHRGSAYYQGLSEILAMEGVYPHIYGKLVTKPYRKMGHITIIDDNLEAAKEKALKVKETIKVVSR